MSAAPRDLTKKLLLAWLAHSLRPEPEFRLAPTDPHIVCRKCWRPKPPEQFSNHRNRAGDFVPATICKACHKTLFGLPRRARLRAAAAVRRAERQQRLKQCRRCGNSRPLGTWAHYPAGNLHIYCSECDAQIQARRAANDEARSRGYDDLTHTPEYHRLQREREAERKGRQLPAYTPQAERERLALLRRAEHSADRHRKKMFRLVVDQYERIAEQDYEVTEEEREAWAAKQREYYARHRQQEVARHLVWKASNRDKVRQHERTRRDHIAATDDCTATPTIIAQMKRAATHCAYCGSRLLIKQTDHIIALALGGPHSIRNIVIVCPDCNGKKHTLSYAKWIERVEHQHRARVLALWLDRYGDAAA